MKSLNPLLESQLQELLDQVVDEADNIWNAIMLIDSQGFKWKGASGMANPNEKVTMDVDDQFFTASTAKMMTATLTMKLVEAKQLRLDDRIQKFLPESIMKGLHTFKGRSYEDRITVRQCLNHTTGLGDNWGDDNFLQLIIENPNKLWEPEETIDYVRQNRSPRFPPGEGFSYSDINYNLIGLIIEEVTKKPLQIAYRDLILDPLDMRHTYRQFREEPKPSTPGRAPSHVFHGETDYSSWKALSADWAGGGLQSTTEDLNRFLRAFIRNEIFNKSSTRDEMFKWVKWMTHEGLEASYGLGIIRVIFEKMGKEEIWGHIGASSCFMFYWPDNDTTFCGTFNQNRQETKFLDILPSLMELLSKEWYIPGE